MKAEENINIELLNEIESLVNNSTTSFLSYIDDEGYPVTKAFLAPPRKRDGLKEMWLSTNTSSNKVRCLRVNKKASLYFIDQAAFKGVSFTGIIDVLETLEDKQRIWREGDTLFYPKGVTDPDYCVLKMTVEKGRFYSNFTSIDFMV